jgi:TolB-like protein/tetratricopeptide (TPR) repeat protein
VPAATARGSASVIQSSKGIFLSYASEDAGMAKRICDALRVAGIEVWFDQSELRGGDAWDQMIRQQIRDCALFVPIISAHTQARPEGYFRLEWKLAVDRSHLMAAEKAFLVPVVADATTELEALVPTQFRDVQWTRIQAGEVPAAFVDRIAALLNQPVAPHVGSPERGISRTPARRLPIVLTALSVTAVVALVIATAMRGGWFSQKPMPKVEASTATTPLATTQSAVSEKSVAVLPFVDMSEKKDQEYFSDGLSEELIDMLARISALRVPARTSSFYFKGRSEDIPTIGRRLMVANVLEGSVRKAGNHLRITAQLVRADTGYHIWSQTYDRPLDDVFKVQDEIAGAVTKALKVALRVGESPPAASAVNTEAYNLRLQARFFRFRGERGDIQKSVELYRQAVQLDPASAVAWAEFARALLAYSAGYQIVPWRQGREPAMRAAERALTLDPRLAQAYGVIAWIKSEDWDWAGAQAADERARALDPQFNDNVDSFLAMTLGNVSEAVALAERSVVTDPLNHFSYNNLVDLYVIQGRLEKAEAAARKAVELSPTGVSEAVRLGEVLVRRGEAQAGLAEIEREPAARLRDASLAWAFQYLGRKAEADAALAHIESSYADVAAYDIATLYAMRGERDRAFSWLERAYQQHDYNLSYILAEPDLASLHQDPRWKPFLRKMNLPE